MFSFKRFSVKDDRCAMKVGADSVLFGAWMDVSGARRLLDAGCGSGLLALMAAQRLCGDGPAGSSCAPVSNGNSGESGRRGDEADFHIDAIDIDDGAVADAADNFAASPWSEHLKARQISLQDFADEAARISSDFSFPADLSGSPGSPAGIVYDHIFCNPPYYDDSPSSGSATRDAARSTDTLTRTELLFAASKLLTERGRLSLILPFDQGKKMILEATLFGWFLTRQCFVKTKATSLPKRLMLEFSPSPGSSLETETPVIGDERYRELTSGFYL